MSDHDDATKGEATRAQAGTWLRIKSDGTPHGTRIETEDGQMIRGVQGVEWRLELGSVARVTIDVVKLPADVVGLAEVSESSLLEDPTAVWQSHIEDEAPEGPGFPERCSECGMPARHHHPECSLG